MGFVVVFLAFVVITIAIIVFCSMVAEYLSCNRKTRDIPYKEFHALYMAQPTYWKLKPLYAFFIASDTAVRFGPIDTIRYAFFAMKIKLTRGKRDSITIANQIRNVINKGF